MALVYKHNDFTIIDSPLSEDEAWEEEWWMTEYDEEVITYSRYPAAQPGMVAVLSVVVMIIVTLALFALRGHTGSAAATTGAPAAQPDMVQEAAPAAAVVPVSGGIAPLFTAEVQHWAPQIIAWSAEVGVDPNMAATIMQVESCGDPNAVSIAGAQGLFQVMPFHFSDGEAMQDPDTNARKGLRYFADRLVQTSGDVGRAFAGYNGGHVAAGSSWDDWYPETQRYYTWTTGIFADAQAGSATSETLNQWLAAGGASLCRQAAQRIGLQ